MGWDEAGDCPPPPDGQIRRADSNDDGKVDISDAVFTLAWLFLGGVAPGCVAVADTNGDGRTDISDPVYTLSFLFLGGPPPVAPYPDCGAIPSATDVLLGCEVPPKNACSRS